MKARGDPLTSLGIALLMAFITLGCGLIGTSPPTKKPTETPTPTARIGEATATPTTTPIPSEPKETSVKVYPKKPTDFPTMTATVEPTESPTRQPTKAQDKQVSPEYDIYVGLILSGDCSPYTNSGGFLSLSFDSAFHNVRFQSPESSGLPMGGFYQGGVIPLLNISGEGEVDRYAFCPAYDGDQEVGCEISEGPKPFEPRLAVVIEEEALPVAPLDPEASELDYGPGLMVSFSIGSAKGGGPIMVWDCDTFYRGAMGGAIAPRGVMYFYLPWGRLMQGEEYALEYPHEEAGEKGMWTLRIVPSKGD